MTFDEYNTDEYFNNKDSTADGLIKTAYDEGKTREEVEKSLSPLWKEDKKGSVKKALDTYYKTEETKAEEQKPTEEKVTEKVIEETAPKKEEKITLDKQSQSYADKQSKTANSAEQEGLESIEKKSDYNWQKLYDSALKRADAYKQIDDHMVEQLPTFMFKRYQNGEFGKPESTDAKLRLAHFMINGVGTALSNISHTIRKDGIQEQSDAEKYQQTNLEEGLRNRWNKYKADTEGAIKAVEKEYGNEQDARLAVEQFTRDHKANVKWNMMDQNQKVFALQVTKEIGSMLGGMDTSELANFIAGAALTGDMSKDEVIAIGVAKLAANAPDIIKNLPEGNVKDIVFSMIGGIGGAGGKTNSNGDQTNLTGNLQNYESIDGSNISFDFSDSKAKDKIQGELNKLTTKYKNGEIDAETFKKYYDPLYAEGKKHLGSIFSTPSSDKALSGANAEVLTSLEEDFDSLNKQAKAGDLSPSTYQDKIKAISEKAAKYGASKEMIDYIKKETLSNEKILKAVDKKSKKKK